MIRYSDVEAKLKYLLEEFGPPRRVFHPGYPFWRLQNDGIWIVKANGPLATVKGNTDPKRSELVKQGARGGFPERVYSALKANPKLVYRIAIQLLTMHFPRSLHADILDAVGLPVGSIEEETRIRDMEFRAAVIRAYQHRCAVCGYDVRLGNSDLGVEAAHIKWFQAGGPDIVPNGLCLCVLHHRLFDRGAIGIAGGRVIVSEDVHGGTAVNDWLFRFEGKKLREPQRKSHAPSLQFIEWHMREVFRSPARELKSARAID